MSYLNRITELLQEGKSTGGDPYFTGKRLEKFASNNPNRVEKIKDKVLGRKKKGKKFSKKGDAPNTTTFKRRYNDWNKGVSTARSEKSRDKQ
jgi:hypothetical protein